MCILAVVVAAAVVVHSQRVETASVTSLGDRQVVAAIWSHIEQLLSGISGRDAIRCVFLAKQTAVPPFLARYLVHSFCTSSTDWKALNL